MNIPLIRGDPAPSRIPLVEDDPAPSRIPLVEDDPAPSRILLVEDDPALSRSVRDAFEAAGFEIEAADDAESALEKLAGHRYGLMLLDVGLPGIDGFELLRRVRASPNDMPVMIVSGHDDPRDRLRGFDLGADDYVVKPFLIDELRARVRAVMRRARPARGPQEALADEPYRRGALEIDLRRRRVLAGGQEIELTRREWTVLEMFLQNSGRVLDKRRLAQACSAEGESLTPNAVEVYVSRLRGKLEPAGDPVRTVRGFGYLWDDTPRSEAPRDDAPGDGAPRNGVP